MISPFDRDIGTPLCKIMGECGSDKGHEHIRTSWHNYTILYYSQFEKMIHKPLRLFEMGLGTNNTAYKSNMGVHGRPGASLRGWATFFSNARIYGADIDRDILFEEDRIKTYYCDQTQAHVIKDMWNTDELREPFDIIIDDGLHEYDANVCFFENSIHKLAKGGYYVIEDILTPLLPAWEQKISEWKIAYPHLIFQLLMLPSTRNPNDNNVLMALHV
jgi:hypothetical protein